MGKNSDRPSKSTARHSLSGVACTMAVGLAVSSLACSAPEAKPPRQPLISGSPSWPEDIVHDADHIERICGQRETKLLEDIQEGKQDQQKFKTMMGSITGGVGTVGGVIGGVGAYVIDSPDTMKTLTGVTGFVSAGLGAVGSVVTVLVSPGTEKIESAQKSLDTIGEKKEAARALLAAKEPGSWGDTEKAAWTKASKELDEVCK